MRQFTIDDAIRAGHLGMARAESSADRRTPDFSRRAAAYMGSLLVDRGPMSGEDLVDAARAAGFTPADDRAFGAAFQRLLRDGAKVVGTCPRRKGHASAGGKVYGIAG